MDYYEDEDNNTRSFKLSQDGKEFIVSLSIIKDHLLISAYESLVKDGNYFENGFSLGDLCAINRYFVIISSIEEAQSELIKCIEKQKVGIEHNLNLLNILFYLSIGTDNIYIKLPLQKRDTMHRRIQPPEEQEPFTGEIQLKNRGTYPEDEQRINNIARINDELKLSQVNLLEDMEKLLIITEQLKKESNLLSEENAKLNVRLQKIQKEVFETNLEVEALREEEQALNDENNQLNEYNAELENLVIQKKEKLKNDYRETMMQKVNKNDIDLGNGPKAVSSRYEAVPIKTFIPRVTAKPNVEAYDEGILNNSRPPFYYTEKRITQYLANNSPNDKLNKTDINLNINNTNPIRGSYRTYNNDYNNDYNNFSDSYNNFYDKDPVDNKHKKKQNNFAYGRISEKTNDYEEEDINNYYNNKTPRESESYQYRESRDTLGNQTELGDEEEKNIKSDIIKNKNEEDMLLNKINNHGKNIYFNLLYKSVIDTDRAEIFHKKCDKALRTLVLVETINGRRFGGYTTQSWEGDGIDKLDNEAFVFSLDKLQIYNVISEKPAIGCYPKYGPVFLGCQIKVNDNFFVKGGTTFRKHINYATNEDFELNDGIKFFGIKDIEVFEVHLI